MLRFRLSVPEAIPIESLFTPFKTVESLLAKGQGLYLIKSQLIALGGKIEIESTVDIGTVFKVYFKNLNR